MRSVFVFLALFLANTTLASEDCKVDISGIHWLHSQTIPDWNEEKMLIFYDSIEEILVKRGYSVCVYMQPCDYTLTMEHLVRENQIQLKLNSHDDESGNMILPLAGEVPSSSIRRSKKQRRQGVQTQHQLYSNATDAFFRQLDEIRRCPNSEEDALE